MDRPVTRSLTSSQAAALRAALVARGHALATNPKNPYIAFEVRTEGRSIVTLYTSRKLVCTLRAGDAEGAGLGALVAELCGDAPAPGASAERSSRADVAHGTRPDLAWLMGADETGTGELLGRAVVAGVALPPAGAPALAEVAGQVETKSGRAASGWEALDERLRGLPGLLASVRPIGNRLFDGWSKNGLLDLAYVRLANDLFAAAGLGAGRPAGGLRGVELAIDDYGAGPLLARAIATWRGDGAHVVLQPRADDEHLAARAASVLARAARSREFEGLKSEAGDGPLGTGNAGNPATLRWMRRQAERVRAGGAWPSFVKASFRTARDLLGQPEVEKRRVPPLHQLLDADAAEAFLHGRFEVTTAAFVCEGGKEGTTRRFVVRADGTLVEPRASVAFELLPLLVSGLVLSESLESDARRDPGILQSLLDRERGLLSGWRLLVGPARDAGDPFLVALARAHRAGIVELVARGERDAESRAAAGGALRLVPGSVAGEFELRSA